MFPRTARTWRRIGGLFGGFVRELRASLLPATELDAQIVDLQLNMVRTNMRLLDYVLPFTGATIVFFAKHIQSPETIVWWFALVANCFVNEMLLDRTHTGSAVARTRARAREMALLAFVLITMWSSAAIWAWHPGADHRLNHLFCDFILAMTLASTSTMLSTHIATALVPILALSAALVLVPGLDGLGRADALIALSFIYVVLMIGQSFANYKRVNRMLRLAAERKTLIVNLRAAKAASDEARRRAVEASKAKSAFLANMSHELRTPLNAIIGFSDIIRTQAFGASTEKYTEYGGFIHQSGHRLLALISGILDLAKIDAGRKVLREEPVDLGALVVDAVSGATEAVRDKGLTISCNTPRLMPLLKADLHGVRQILDNLLDNAIRYTPPPGRIDVAIRISDAGEIIMSVADTGIGISGDDRERIFDRFGSGEPEVTSFDHGLGLGLPIIKGLADMHGARLDVTTALGQGTTIAVVFPASSTLVYSDLRVA